MRVAFNGNGGRTSGFLVYIDGIYRYRIERILGLQLY
jgi:hypothetical protein